MNDIILLAIPFFTALVLLEIFLCSKMQSERYTTWDTFGSLSMGVGNAIIGVLIKGVIFLVYSFFYQYRIIDLEMSFVVGLSLFLLDDFCYYWFHRISHESRFLWASHSIHHSSQKYNLSTALRQTWTGDLSGSFLFWVGLPLLGFKPEWVMLMKAISLIYQFWIHTELIKKLPKWFEFIFNTPSHHRVHHAVQAKYLDRNHAGILIIWDRIFGTFIQEKEQPVYGLIKNINSNNPIQIAFHEWRLIFKDLKLKISLADKLRYIFFAPGWSHDGSRMSSEQIRKKELQKQNQIKLGRD